VAVADLVIPGVWWLRGTRGSNVFLVEADDGQLALIDTGFASSADAVLRRMETLAPRRTLSAILLTHGHLDHAGAAAEVRAATGARVVAGAGDCRIDGKGCAELTPRAGSRRATRRGRKDRPSTALEVDHVVSGEEEVLPGIVAVPVPGHTTGSLCYGVGRLDAAFVGDLVIVHGQELTRPLRGANADDATYLQSLARFAERAPSRGFPGHGNPVLEEFGPELRKLAALPRRRAGPLQHLVRMRRLATFGYRLGSRR
jgi:glyoxylase-like metal-dependent hydrolase (beta-lactamase superfamily II)